MLKQFYLKKPKNLNIKKWTIKPVCSVCNKTNGKINKIVKDENYIKFLEVIVENILSKRYEQMKDLFSHEYNNLKTKYGIGGKKIDEIRKDLKLFLEQKISSGEINYENYKDNIFINQILSLVNLEKDEKEKDNEFIKLINKITNYTFTSLEHYINYRFYDGFLKTNNISILDGVNILIVKIKQLEKEGKITKELLEIHKDFYNLLNSEIIVINPNIKNGENFSRDKIKFVLNDDKKEIITQPPTNKMGIKKEEEGFNKKFSKKDTYFTMLDKVFYRLKNNISTKIIPENEMMESIKNILEKEEYSITTFYIDVLDELEEIIEKNPLQNNIKKSLITDLKKYINDNPDY